MQVGTRRVNAEMLVGWHAGMSLCCYIQCVVCVIKVIQEFLGAWLCLREATGIAAHPASKQQEVHPFCGKEKIRDNQTNLGLKPCMYSQTCIHKRLKEFCETNIYVENMVGLFFM